jgi:hypothetical protein
VKLAFSDDFPAPVARPPCARANFLTP